MIEKYLKRHSHVNWALADQAIVSGVNFLTGILIARFLGIEEFGIFTLVWMIVLFSNSIQMAMISSPMMTIGPKQPEKEKNSYYGTVVIHQLIFSILSCGIVWIGFIISDFIFPQWQLTQLTLPLISALFFFQNQDFIRRLLFTERRARIAFINDVVSYIGRIGLLLMLFFYSDTTTTDVLWVIALTSLIAIFIGIYSLNELEFSKQQIWTLFKRHWVISKWMTASAILQWTSGNYFALAAGSILGPAALGALKAAQNIVAINHILFQGLENIVPASASRLFNKTGIDGLKQYLIKVSLWGGGTTILIAVALSIFPEHILQLVYGDQYVNYGYVLRWYALCYVLMFFGLPLRSGLRVLESSRPIFVAYVFMTVFSLIFALILVNNWKLEGAAIGVVFTQVISIVSLFYFFKKKAKDITV